MNLFKRKIRVLKQNMIKPISTLINNGQWKEL
jgi:hypothetical protein